MSERRPTLCVVAPRLLYRTTDGEVLKQYVEDVPEWAKTLLKK